ncbi:hypothetical protein TNCV_2874021 [Trichonephila clavipes]|nr:hypothetical protein TNCV_2874021 [Trichonephila clavipes]
MNSSMTFSAAWLLSSETMAEVTPSRWSHPCLAALAACIHNRRTGPSLGVKIWGVIEYKSQPPLVRIDDTRNSAHYFYGALQTMTLPFIQALRNLTFRSLTNRKRLVQGCRRLACHHTPITTVDELWHLVEAAWASVPVHAIQSLFYSISKLISAVIMARGGCSGGTDFSGLCTQIS